TTDIDGRYEVDIPEDTPIILRYTIVGFEAVELAVQSQSVINVTLKAKISDLEEVVVVGYGNQKKANLTGSVQSITFDDAVNAPVTNSAQLMYGKFSGV